MSWNFKIDRLLSANVIADFISGVGLLLCKVVHFCAARLMRLARVRPGFSELSLTE